MLFFGSGRPQDFYKVETGIKAIPATSVLPWQTSYTAVKQSLLFMFPASVTWVLETSVLSVVNNMMEQQFES